MDDLFNGLGTEGQKRFRAYLQNRRSISIVATTQSLWSGVSKQVAPFFGFFRIEHLQELNIDEATSLLKRIAELKKDTELVDYLGTTQGRARVRAVHHLAGGHPRIYVIFSQFLSRESLDDLVQPFMNLLDSLTPYYQARMSYLPGQQRKIVEFLCEYRGAAQVKEIARRCLLSQQAAAAQLKELKEKGYVRSESIGRDAFYELREVLMRMTVEVKKNHDEVNYISATLSISIRVIRDLRSIGDMKNWQEIWKESTSSYPELRLIDRILSAETDFRISENPRVLLGLPVEERVIVEELGNQRR